MSEFEAQGGEQEGPVGTLGRRQPIQGGLEDPHFLGVDLPEGAVGTPVVGERGSDELVDGPEFLGLTCGFEEGLTKGRDAGLPLGRPEAQEETDPKQRIRQCSTVGELECLGEVADPVLGGKRFEGVFSRPGGVGDGLVGVHRPGGQQEVAGQLTDTLVGPVPEQLLQRFSHQAVHPGPAGRPHVFVEGVLDQRVGKPIATGRPGQLADEVGRLSVVEEIEQGVLVGSGDFGQEIDVEVPPDDRRCREDFGGPIPQPSHPGAHHLADAVGQGELTESLAGDPMPGGILHDGTRLGEVAQHLGDEERVAVGLPVDRMGELHARLVQDVASGDFQEGHDVAVIESLQVEPRHSHLPVESCQGLGQGGDPRELRAAVRAEHEEPAGAGVGHHVAE